MANTLSLTLSNLSQAIDRFLTRVQATTEDTQDDDTLTGPETTGDPT